MGEVTIHAGLLSTGAKAVQGWLAAHRGALAQEHGLVVHQIRADRSRAGPVATHAGSLRVVTTTTGSCDSSVLWELLKPRVRSGDDRGVSKLADRLRNELGDQANRHGSIILSGLGIANVLFDRVDPVMHALDELAQSHRVRLIVYAAPQHELLEHEWRETGFRAGRDPSLWLTKRSQLADHGHTVQYAAETAPHVEIVVRPHLATQLHGGTVASDLASLVLKGAARDLDPVDNVPSLPLRVANLVWAGPVDRFLDGIDGRAAARTLTQTVAADEPGRWAESDRLLEARTRLQAWCYARFRASNESLATRWNWPFTELVEDPGIDPPADLGFLDRCWLPEETAEEVQAQLTRWRSAVTPAPLDPGRRATAELLDLACGGGDTLAKAQTRFGVEGIGIERDLDKVLSAQAKGRPVFQGDIRHITPDQFPSVDYVVLDNALEHLPSIDDVRDVVRAACTIAARCVYIRHPSFEGVDELAQLGCKLYWTDWPTEHPTHISLDEFRSLAAELGVREIQIRDIVPIGDSSDPRVLPLGAPPDQFTSGTQLGPYDPRLHGPKPDVVFDHPAHYAHDIVLVTGDGQVLLEYGRDPEHHDGRPVLKWIPVRGTAERDRARADLAHGAPAFRHPGVHLLDLGCGVGQSLIDAQGRFGMPGVGIEIDPDRVTQAVRRGLTVHQGDVRTIDPRDYPDVDFVYLDNVLEHLPSPDDVDTVLGLACDMARKLVVIRHPSFEDVAQLADLGLKLYWTDWRGHTAPMRLAQLVDMLSARGFHRVAIQPYGPIADSDSPLVLPIGAPPDQTRVEPSVHAVYDRARHGPKPEVRFARPVFEGFEILIATGDGTYEVAGNSGVSELRWREVPGHAPAAWADQLQVRDDPGATVDVVERPDGRVVVLEKGKARVVPSPMVARALQLLLGSRTITEEDFAALPLGPPVTALKVPGQSAFVVVGGRRHPLPGVPATLIMDAETAAVFPVDRPLDLLRAAAELHDARRARPPVSAPAEQRDQSS